MSREKVGTMSIRRTVAFSLALTMAIGTVPSLVAASQSGAGILSGKADAAKAPYSDYKVQVRDVTSGQIVTSAPLDQQGRFAFNGLGLPGRYVLELVTGNQVKCTAGPYALTTPSMVSRTDVNIACGGNAALWLLAAAGGAAAAIAFAVNASPSR
jgi:hypothetical protein